MEKFRSELRPTNFWGNLIAEAKSLLLRQSRHTCVLSINLQASLKNFLGCENGSKRIRLNFLHVSKQTLCYTSHRSGKAQCTLTLDSCASITRTEFFSDCNMAWISRTRCDFFQNGDSCLSTREFVVAVWTAPRCARLSSRAAIDMTRDLRPPWALTGSQIGTYRNSWCCLSEDELDFRLN